MFELIEWGWRRVPAILLAILLTATSARAEPLRLPAWLAVGGAAADTLSSVRFTANGSGCTERNPWTRDAGAHYRPGPGVAIKAATIGVALLVMRTADSHGHPRYARAIGYLAAGVGFGAATYNVQNCGW